MYTKKLFCIEMYFSLKIKTIEFNLYSIHSCLSKDITINCIIENYNFNLQEKLFEFNVSDIKCKLWAIPFKNKFIIFPILHNLFYD